MKNKLCALYLSLKSDTIPSPVAIVTSHRKNCHFFFRVATSPFAGIKLEKKEIKKKMMDFNYYGE